MAVGMTGKKINVVQFYLSVKYIVVQCQHTSYNANINKCGKI